eukprot:8604858-Ditylum_brightwellii.AAC.1
MDNTAVCSNNSDDNCSNNNDEYSKTDQTEKQHHQSFHLQCYATISSKKFKQAVTHKELLAAFPSPPAVPMIALTFSKMLKVNF